MRRKCLFAAARYAALPIAPAAVLFPRRSRRPPKNAHTYTHRCTLWLTDPLPKTHTHTQRMLCVRLADHTQCPTHTTAFAFPSSSLLTRQKACLPCLPVILPRRSLSPAGPLLSAPCRAPHFLWPPSVFHSSALATPLPSAAAPCLEQPLTTILFAHPHILITSSPPSALTMRAARAAEGVLYSA